EPTVTVALSGTGSTPEIDVAPSALDFGEQDVDAGPAVSRQVTVANDGNGNLHVTGITLNGDDASEFVIESGGEVFTLMPGNTHAILLAFDPSTMGAKSAELQIQSDDDDEPTVIVTLSGAGAAAPEIVVAPLALDFGEQDVDAGPAPSQTVIIGNEGSTELHITGVVLTGTGTGKFAIDGDTGEATLAPGATRTLQVSFDPSSTGAQTAVLSIQSDDADESTVNVALAGTGTTTTFLLTVSKDGPGQGTVGSTPAGINCGEACQAGFVAGTPVTLTATTGTGFFFVGWQGEGCSGTGMCHVTMDAARHVTATFDVAPGYPGYGSTPAPGSTLNVGITEIGVLISTTMTIYETGDVTLVVTPTLSGAAAADFSITPPTLSILDGGAAQALTVSCTPSMAGTRAATLTVAHNAPGSPAFYPLRCTGGTVQTVYLPLVVKN
ncbi:MAG: choice-of-anchor D domain-containing protein, partial [Anaerolineae bacterium]|nr:choice-of-anchor D domain-containing protein [Anaerolineae bacterium]